MARHVCRELNRGDGDRGYEGFAMNDLFYVFSFENIYFGFQ